MPLSSKPIHRKVLRIRAEDSPNVQAAFRMLGISSYQEWVELGKPDVQVPEVIPGILDWTKYVARRSTWDKARQCVGLDGEFYEGAEERLYPPAWLGRARLIASRQQRASSRLIRAMGVDPGEGEAKTVWVIGDSTGVLELLSRITKDTSEIVGQTKALISKWGIDHQHVIFDRGGGGKQHVDTLKRDGYQVRSVSFGESISVEPKRGLTLIEERKEAKAERSVYRTLRGQMYWQLREMLDPSRGDQGFGIPDNSDALIELHRQMSLIPLKWDSEGQLYLPPKQRRDPNDRRVTMTEIIGHSPDELDALVLMVHGLLHKGQRVKAGVPA